MLLPPRLASHRLRLAPAVLLLTASAACGGDSGAAPTPDPDPGPSATPASLSAFEFPSQPVRVGTEIPLQVRVLDAQGRPVSDAQVNWTAGTPGHSFSDATSTSSSQGIAGSTWRTDGQLGRHVARASVAGVEALEIDVETIPGFAVTFEILGPDTLRYASLQQRDTIQFESFDGFGNDVADPIIWRILSGPRLNIDETSGELTTAGEGEGWLFGRPNSPVERLDSVYVVVRQVPVTLEIVEGEVRVSDSILTYVDGRVDFDVVAADSVGVFMPRPEQVTWTSLAPNDLTVDAAGVVTFAGVGTGQVVVAGDGLNDTLTVTVRGDRLLGRGATPHGDEVISMGLDGRGVRVLTQSDGNILNPTWSPDGSQFAWINVVADQFRLLDRDVWVANRDGSGARPLTTDGGFKEGVDWSPDGTELLMYGSRGIMAVDVTTGSERVIGDSSVGEATSLRWSPDGSEIAYISDGAGIRLAADGTGEPVQFTSQGDRFTYLDWSPDGSSIVLVLPESADGAGIIVMNPDGTGRTNVYPRDYPLIGVEWSPDGSTLLIRDDKLRYLRDGIVVDSVALPGNFGGIDVPRDTLQTGQYFRWVEYR